MLIRNAPGSGPALPELHRRLRWVVVAVVTAFAALVGRLWQLQVVRGDEYYEEALSNVVHRRFLPSVRGRILDRDGEPLADNRPAFNVYVLPTHFDEIAPELVMTAEPPNANPCTYVFTRSCCPAGTMSHSDISSISAREYPSFCNSVVLT